jgi:hypothetical protein
MKKAPMKYPREVELREWSLAAVDGISEKLAKVLEGAVLEAATEAVGIALADDHADLYLPFLGGFDGVTDPLELRFMIPLGGDSNDGPVYRTNLTKIVRDCSIHEDDGERWRQLAKALRELADELDAGADPKEGAA